MIKFNLYNTDEVEWVNFNTENHIVFAEAKRPVRLIQFMFHWADAGPLLAGADQCLSSGNLMMYMYCIQLNRRALRQGKS